MKQKSSTKPAVYLLTAICFLSLFIFGCQKDDSAELVKIDKSNLYAATEIPAGGYNIENSLPEGYVKDGSVDYTDYLQKAINNNNNIVFPAFPILVNDKGLKVGSNKTLSFLKGSELRLKPTAKDNYHIVRLDDASNVVLNNLVIVGDRENHLGKDGKFGMGLSIYGGNNIVVNSPVISNCWAEGIFVAKSNKGEPTSNLTISNAICNYNRRDGIKILSVDGLKLENPEASFNSGLAPMNGILFHADDASAEFKNISITNAKTNSNQGNGIEINLSNLYGKANKVSSFSITNHQDTDSKQAFYIDANLSKRGGNEKVAGEISIVKPVWSSRTKKTSVLKTLLYDEALKLSVNTPFILVDGKALSETEVKTLLTNTENINIANANYILSFSDEAVEEPVKNPPVSGYNIQDALPKGYTKNGTVDYTSEIQKAIDKNDVIVFPGFPILVNEKGLVIKSNKTITFLKGSEVIMKPNGAKNYQVFSINNVSNVTLNGPVIKGDRAKHTGTSEWGSGIAIYGSSNITINDAVITDCWGDGILLGSASTVNKNIVIDNAYSSNNRRMGFAILSVDGLLLNSSYAGYSKGLAWSCGVDIEPNSPSDEAKNIKIVNLTTEHNFQYGLMTSLSKLYGAGNKTTSIEIINHQDFNSGVAQKFSSYESFKRGSERVTGEIKVTNPVYKFNKSTNLFMKTALFDKDLKLTVSNPKVAVGNSYLSNSEVQKLLVTKTYGNININAVYSLNF